MSRYPDRFNIAEAICDRHATVPGHKALIYENETGEVQEYTFTDFKRLSNRLANAFLAMGLQSGDRIGILLSQSPETAICHLATYKIGAIAVPLFTLFGTDALEFRLNHSGAKCIVTDSANAAKLNEIRDQLQHLELILVVDANQAKLDRYHDFWGMLEKGTDHFDPIPTRADDPALIIYTSGTTGPPKGALHAHRVLLGHLPGVEFPHDFFPEPGDCFWTPADWAWIGGLIDVLFPSWYHGVPVVAHRARKFDPEHAFHLLAKHKIRNAFLPPTALKLMRQVQDPRRRYDFRLRSVGSGGETLGEELLQWGRESLGVAINEFYGQTEVNLVVANCAAIAPIKPGSMGLAVPGHAVAIVDDEGRLLPTGEVGNIAIKRPDPVMFLPYWQNQSATDAKFRGDWCLTGDLGQQDAEGYFWFAGREDDIITSAGYRIGPGEIEDCLIKHPAVALAAVVGCPDELRTQIVKAYIVPKEGVTPGEALEKEIQQYVRRRLAAHEYPRQIEFVDELPMTATGKIMRRVLRAQNLPQAKRNKGEKDDT